MKKSFASFLFLSDSSISLVKLNVCGSKSDSEIFKSILYLTIFFWLYFFRSAQWGGTVHFQKILCLRLVIVFLPMYLELVHLQIWRDINMLSSPNFALKLAQPKISLSLLNTQLTVQCRLLQYYAGSARTFFSTFASKFQSEQSRNRVLKENSSNSPMAIHHEGFLVSLLLLPWIAIT